MVLGEDRRRLAPGDRASSRSSAAGPSGSCRPTRCSPRWSASSAGRPTAAHAARSARWSRGCGRCGGCRWPSPGRSTSGAAPELAGGGRQGPRHAVRERGHRRGAAARRDPAGPAGRGGLRPAAGRRACCTPPASPCAAAPTRCCAASSRAGWACDEGRRDERRGDARAGADDRRDQRRAGRARRRGVRRPRSRASGSTPTSGPPSRTPASPGSPCPATSGGSEARFADAGVVLAAAGAHAARVPLVETDLLAGWLLQAAEIPLPDGPLTLAVGRPRRRPHRPPGGGRAAPGAVGARRRRDRRAGGRPRAADRPRRASTITDGANLAEEPRDTVVVDGPVTASSVEEHVGTQLRLRAALGRSLLLAGALRAALAASVRYAGERVQFGRPIGRFQAVQQQLALAAAEVAAASAAAEAAARAADADGVLAAELPIAMAKARTSEAAGVGRPDRAPGARRDRVHPRARPAPGHHAAVGVARRGRVRGAVAGGRRGGRAGGGPGRAVAADHRHARRSPVRRESGDPAAGAPHRRSRARRAPASVGGGTLGSVTDAGTTAETAPPEEQQPSRAGTPAAATAIIRPRTAPGLYGLALGALGVVFGDIGTSPLYAVQTVFSIDDGAVKPTVADVYGVVSLIFWSITIVVSVKYVSFILRADNDGEGGIMALAALVRTVAGGHGPPRGVRAGPRRARRLAVLRRLAHHARDLGAVGRRGPRGGAAGPGRRRPADRRRHPRGAVRRAALRHAPGRPAVRAGHGRLVRRAGRAGRAAHRPASRGAAGALADATRCRSSPTTRSRRSSPWARSSW